MRLRVKKNTIARQTARQKKKVRIRKTVRGTEMRPRLCIYRSGKHMYAQIVNDDLGKTLLTASSLKIAEKASGKEVAVLVGKQIAKLAQEKNIKNVVFDRNGFIYHGRVKALADGAREAGLNF